MYSTKEIVLKISNEIQEILKNLKIQEINDAVKIINSHKKIFILAAGRSKLSLSALAMRLMHLEKYVHIVGDVTTPSIKENDLLIIASGSGNTDSVVSLSNIAKNIGCYLLLITYNKKSNLSKIADKIVFINSPNFNENDLINKTIQPIASLFEQSLLILSDIIVLKLIHLNSLSQ